MNSKGHLIISIVKSIIRISGCISSMLFTNILFLAISFLVAEVLGIAEELVDNR